MATLQLKVQYFQDSTPTEVPCREENFVVRELDFALPVEQVHGFSTSTADFYAACAALDSQDAV